MCSYAGHWGYVLFNCSLHLRFIVHSPCHLIPFPLVHGAFSSVGAVCLCLGSIASVWRLTPLLLYALCAPLSLLASYPTLRSTLSLLTVPHAFHYTSASTMGTYMSSDDQGRIQNTVKKNLLWSYTSKSIERETTITHSLGSTSH